MLLKLTEILNNIISLRKENKSIPSSSILEFNNLVVELNNDPHKVKILKELYNNNTDNTFFNEYFTEIIKLLTLNYGERNYLLQEDLPISLKNLLFKDLKSEEKITYLVNNKKLDTELINTEIKTKNKKFLRFLFSDIETLHKIPDDSLEIPIGVFSKYLDLTKLTKPLLSKITKESLAAFINYKYSNSNLILNLCHKNRDLINYLPNQSLTITINNKNALMLLLKNEVNILSKLDATLIRKYLNFYDLEEISYYEHISSTTMLYISELKVILGNKDEDYDVTFFINSSDDHSLIIYPFYEDRYDRFKNLIKDYKYLRKFSYEIIEMVINNYYSFDEKVSLLRNKEIIDDLDSNTLTNILNTLNLRTVLNLIQNKDLLRKITGLNCVLEDLDKTLVKALLDDSRIVDKSKEELIYNSLNLLSNNSLKKYLTYPYIKEKLSLNTFLLLASKCGISVKDLINNYDIKTYNIELNLWIKEYVNNLFKNKPKFSLINDLEDLQLIFNLDSNTVSRINLNELEYLYEMIVTKTNLKKGNTTITYEHLEALIKCYLLLGFMRAVDLINTGSSKVTFDDIMEIKRTCKKVKLTQYKINNELIFANLTNKMIANLESIGMMFHSDENPSNLELSTVIYDYPYLKNVVRLMEETGYAKINHTLNILERFISYNYFNKDIANNIMKNYCDNFISYLLEQESKRLDNIILDKLDDTLVITKDAYKTYLATSKKDFLSIYHFKLFTYLLSNKLASKDTSLFKKNTDKILTEYTNKILKDLPKIFTPNSLITLFTDYYKNRLDITSYLKSLGIYMPVGYLEAKQMVEEKELVKKINSFIVNNFDKTDVRLQVMNDILYHSYSYKYPTNLMKRIKSYQDSLEHFLGNAYLDKSNMVITYQEGVPLGEEKDIKDYDKLVNFLIKIINNTKKYISTIFNDEMIIKRYNTEFENYKKLVKHNYELNKKNFVVKQTGFDLDNLVNIFKEVNITTLDKDLQWFLYDKKNIYLAGLGLSTLYNVSFSSILNNFEAITSIYEESNIPLTELTLEDASMLTLYLDEDKNNIDILDKDYHHSLYAQAHMISSSIPYISKVHNNIAYKVIDKQDIKLTKDNQEFILDPNSCVIKITDVITNEVLATVYGFRMGNSLVIDVSSVTDEDIIKTIDVCGENIIEKTHFVDGTEAIDFLILRGTNITGGIRLKENNTSLYHKFLTRYTTNLELNDLYITSSKYKSITPKNFLDYEAIHPYLRKRNKVIELPNTVSQEKLNKAKKILKIYALDYNLSYQELENNLAHYNRLIVGDDWLIIIKDNNEVACFAVGNDERKERELNEKLIKLGRDDLYVRNYHRLYR